MGNLLRRKRDRADAKCLGHLVGEGKPRIRHH